MFCTKDARPFVPLGRVSWKRHPGATMPSKTPETSQLNIQLFQKFNLNEASNEGWRLRKSASSLEEGDEELYYKENVVIWSRTSPQASQVLRSFLVESPVKEALWCSFIMPTDRDVKHNINYSQMEATAYLQTCVCIMEENKASFFCTNGKDYVSALPIPVKKVWSMVFGLLFERSTANNDISIKDDKNLPVLFSLIHPLDEVVPVIQCTHGMQGVVSFVSDVNTEVVYAEASNNLVVIYNRSSRKHSVWNLRWASPEELKQLGGGPTEVSLSLASIDISKCGGPFNIRDVRPSRPSLTSLDLSHLPSTNSRPSTPFSFNRLSTPIPPHVMGYVNTPHVIKPGHGFKHHGNQRMATPPHAIYSPFDCESPVINPTIPERSTLIEPCQNLSPEICIELLWTEPVFQNNSDKASKAFFTEDFAKNHFLCLLLSSISRLRCIGYTTGASSTFGVVCNIYARDAVPLPSLHMMAVLDPDNVLILYTGVIKMTRICIAEMNAPPRTTLLHTPYVNFIDPAVPSYDDPVLSGNIYQDTKMKGTSIVCLRDAVNNRFNYETSDGNITRIFLPPLKYCSIVEACIEALKSVLKKDAINHVMSHWYQLINTPGSTAGLDEWALFQACFLSLMGYKDPPHEQHCCGYNSPDDCKKAKLSSGAIDEDWLKLLKEVDMKDFCHSHNLPFDLSDEINKIKSPPVSTINQSEKVSLNKKAILYSHAYSIFMALHLCYEDFKLDMCQGDNAKLLVKFLHRLSMDLQLPAYSDHYSRDLPILFSSDKFPGALFSDPPPNWPISTPPCIYSWLTHLITTSKPAYPFPFLPNLNSATRHIIKIFAYEFAQVSKISEIDWKDYMVCLTPTTTLATEQNSHGHNDRFTAIVQLASKNSSVEKHLPLAFKLPLIHSVLKCRPHPPLHWSASAYSLIGREDLAKQIKMNKKYTNHENDDDDDKDGDVDENDMGYVTSGEVINAGVKGRNELIKKYLESREDDEVGVLKKKEMHDGMSNIDSELLKLRFSKDLRVKEIRKMLRSSTPIKVAIQQRPGTSDHELMEDQEKYLLSVSIRTMALSVGRGILTMGTYLTIPTEALPIPKLCLSGRVPPRNNLIEMNHIDIPTSILEWPQFHNGVAAGLCINNKIKLESSWILFNKLTSDKMTNEHAGFLMGQGLNGQLSNLATLNVHDYLIKGNEIISIGLLLGMAADKRGTMDSVTVRTLSIHIPALLPPTSTELDVPHNVQVASVMGVGLLYQCTGNRHISEVLLAEIGRPPGPEMESSIDRESYSLAAGFALGNVRLAKGGDSLGLSERELSDQLFYYMYGTKRKPLSANYKERLKVGSCQIKEAECVNVDVTGPSAVVALALIYHKSTNKSISEWLIAPETPALLETIKPDLLLLRTVAYGLIMWDHVKPCQQWVLSNVPKIIQESLTEKSQNNSNIDVEHMCQSYVNIVTGACMAIALKYAGTADTTALHCLNHFFCMWHRWQKESWRVDVVGRYTLEQCLCTLLLNIAMVMSGTGDLEVLRKCRLLRSRISPHVSYGSHMVVAMATGLLVFGGGRYNLCTSPKAIAAMLCAFYPKYPMHSDENRFHLQAFRHLYCLAAEKRMLLPRDVCTNTACSVDLSIVLKDGTTRRLTAPVLLPELNTLQEVHLTGHKYWHVSFKKDLNWSTLKGLLGDDGVLYVKQKTPPHLCDNPKLTGSSCTNKFFISKQLQHATLQESFLKDLSIMLSPSRTDDMSTLWQNIVQCFLTFPNHPPSMQVLLHQNLLWGVLGMKEQKMDVSFIRQFRLILCMHNRLLQRGKQEVNTVREALLCDNDVDSKPMDISYNRTLADREMMEDNDHDTANDMASENEKVSHNITNGNEDDNGELFKLMNGKTTLKTTPKSVRRVKNEERTCVLLHEVVMFLSRQAEHVLDVITVDEGFKSILRSYLSTSSVPPSASPQQLMALSYYLLWNDVQYTAVPFTSLCDKTFVQFYRQLMKLGLSLPLIKSLHTLLAS